jgi:recombination protein RecT
MASEIAIFENTLRPLTSHFEQALGRAMPVERLMRTIMISIEKTPKLLQANRQTLLNAAMSAACLGLEVDGVTGQAFLVPFAGKVQLIVGYKGYNTLGARAGITIQGEVVREGDEFDYELGDRSFVHHKPKLGTRGPILASWATATALNRPAIVSVLGIDDLMLIKSRSPAVKGGFDTPWNEPILGFPAMCSKTAKRRLARSTPLNVMQVAAAMEEAHEERGKLAWIDPSRGVQIEGEEFHDGPQINHDQRDTAELLAPRTVSAQVGTRAPEASAAPVPSSPQPQAGAADDVPTAAEYILRWLTEIGDADDPAQSVQMAQSWNEEKSIREKIEWPAGSFVDLQRKVKRAIEALKPTAETDARITT